MSNNDNLTNQFGNISMDDPSLKCTICREYYTEPRILPCSHNFCTQCLVRHRNNDNTCPECRAVCNTPVMQLTLNLTLKNLAIEKKREVENANLMAAGEVPQPPPAFFAVKIHDLHGKTYRVHSIRPETTVIELKARVGEVAGMPPSEQRLIYQGTQLEDDKVMKDYNIGKDCTIHLVVRLRGGILVLAA